MPRKLTLLAGIGLVLCYHAPAGSQPKLPRQKPTKPVGASSKIAPRAGIKIAPRAGTKIALRAGALRAGNMKVTATDKATMVYVPAGEFVMGSTAKSVEGAYQAALAAYPQQAVREWFSYEMPQHKVYLNAYWIDKTPVTVEQYRRFCEATKRAMPAAPAWGWVTNHPIVNVSWADANAYAQWAGKRLPTEAEWEKAARGTDGREYPWGDKWNASRLWCSADSVKNSTAPVNRHPSGASIYGVFDMAGNVLQWCSDWYDTGYYKTSAQRNPAGPATGSERVLRGGSWPDLDAGDVRAACRHHYAPDGALDRFGIRCVASAG